MTVLQHITTRTLCALLIWVPLTAALTGCNDFLDVQPVGKVMPKTTDEVRALMTEAYTALPTDLGLTTFRSDEMVMDGSSSTSEALTTYLDLWLWRDDNPDEGTGSFSWRSFYYVQYIANYVIEQESQMTGGTALERQQLVGEAYFLRAYVHFTLVNLFAQPYTACQPATTRGIPLKLNSDVNTVLSPSTVAEVYEAVLEDLKAAQSRLNVTTWDEGYTYRATPLACTALDARVNLYMGNWEKAYDLADTVLQAHPALEDLNTATLLPNHYQSVESILALDLPLPAQYQTAGRVNPALLALYRTGDLRKSKYYQAVTASVSNVIKGGGTAYRCTFRTAEFVLMQAECALNLDQTSTAAGHLKHLMAVRYAPALLSRYTALIDKMTADELRQEIANERFREFAFEGHRWFDLRRTTRPALEKTYQGTTFTLQADDSRYTLRIPAEAIEANPGLDQ